MIKIVQSTQSKLHPNNQGQIDRRCSECESEEESWLRSLAIGLSGIRYIGLIKLGLVGCPFGTFNRKPSIAVKGLSVSEESQ